jgi:Glycosyltransferase family 87
VSLSTADESALSQPGNPSPRLSLPGLRSAGRTILEPFVYGVLPGLLLTLVVAASVHNHFAFDFHQFWQGGRDVVHGQSPYPAAGSIPASGDQRLDAVAVQHVYRFPYPAPAALLMTPFGLLPFALAAAIFLLLSIVSVVLALRLLEVTDWRCYGIVFASITTLGAVRLGTFTPILLLGIAVAWRFRNRPTICGAAVCGLVAVKVFLWPLLVWLAFSRRTGTAALAAAGVAIATLGSWVVIGFTSMDDYPHLLSSLAASVQGKSWSFVALALSLGATAVTAKALSLVVGVALLGVAAVRARARQDASSFTFAIGAALVLSPIVWLHYFLLLVAPLAIGFPTLSLAWAIPLIFWAWPLQESRGNTWTISLGLFALAWVSALMVGRPRRAFN